MQLNKLVKVLLVALPVMAVTACSSHKNDKDQTGMGTGSGDAYGNGTSSNGGLSEQARLQMQELQRNNIVYFGLDKYDIQSDYAQLLDQHAAFLRSNPSVKVTIEGHADERGTPEYNIALGERRASAVKMYLQGRGVAEDQMAIVSYGKEKPAVLGHDDAAYAKNRRAVLVY